MSLLEAAKKRKLLEDRYYLPHDASFDDRLAKETRHTLLILAVLVSIVYGGIFYIHARNNTPAQPGQIYAKSDLTEREIKQLDIVK